MPDADLAIEPSTQLPDLLEKYPQARIVLDRYGLRGCGGVHGPAESLRFFARAHAVEESLLLTELRDVAANPEKTKLEPADFEPHVDDTIYRRYFIAGILTVLIAGGGFGIWLLWQIGVSHSFIGVSIFDINSHGHALIFGWVGLFIVGFAYQAFPRFWRTRLEHPPLAVAVFVTLVIGLIAKTAGIFAVGTSWGLSAATFGGALELAGIMVFAWQILVTFTRSEAILEPWVGFIFAALFFFVAQAVLSLWHTWMTMTAAYSQQLFWYVSTYQSPLRDLQIHGLALLMIVGVNLRMVPAFYDVPTPSRRRPWSSLAILTTAVVAEAVLFVAYRWTGIELLAETLELPWCMLIVGVAMVVIPWKLWRPLRDMEGQIDRTAKFIRAGYGWLSVSLGMLVLLPLYLYVTGLPFSHAYYGAVRHAIAVGFISLMIMGFAAKVVPTLNGIDPRKMSKLWGPFILINLGCFLRVTMQTLTDSHPGVFPFVAISGVLELTALTWWGWELCLVMHRGKRADVLGEIEMKPMPDRIISDHRVADVLDWFPATEAVFMRHGFSGICNPVLRRTMARQVSIRQASALQGVPLQELLNDLNNAACVPGRI